MTPQDEQSLIDGLNAWEEHKRRKAIKNMFKKKSFDDQFKDWNYVQRILYWVKTIICLLLKRTHGSYLNNSVCVINWDFYPSCGEYDGYNWTACWVEIGLFKNWKVCICSDSSY